MYLRFPRLSLLLAALLLPCLVACVGEIEGGPEIDCAVRSLSAGEPNWLPQCRRASELLALAGGDCLPRVLASAGWDVAHRWECLIADVDVRLCPESTLDYCESFGAQVDSSALTAGSSEACAAHASDASASRG